MDQRHSGSRPPQQQPRRSSGSNPATLLLASIILGVSIIIAGASVTGSVKKLTAAVESKDFASSYVSPSDITVNNTAPKNYYTEQEAAAYLNMTVEEIRAAITKKEIKEYVKTSAGYSISQKILDDYFEKKAYDTLNSNNAAGAGEGEG